MRKPLPTPGLRNSVSAAGLAYALFLRGPAERRNRHLPRRRIGQESHFTSPRSARRGNGRRVAFDARGHGRLDGEFGQARSPTRSRWLTYPRAHPTRGPSADRAWAASVALARRGRGTPAGGRGGGSLPGARGSCCCAGVRSGRLTDFRMDRDQLEPWLETLDIQRAVASLAGNGVLFTHARRRRAGAVHDPEELFESAESRSAYDPPGGHHRLQHDRNAGRIAALLAKAFLMLMPAFLMPTAAAASAQAAASVEPPPAAVCRPRPLRPAAADPAGRAAGRVRHGLGASATWAVARGVGDPADDRSAVFWTGPAGS